MTTLIRNVQLFAAHSPVAHRGDIFISGAKISGVGMFPEKHADIIIDGGGAYALPGIIDAHSELDHFSRIFNVSALENAARNGITTIVVGHEGVSLAPLSVKSLDLLKPWSTLSQSFSWHTMQGFRDKLREIPPPLNITTIVGLDSIYCENKKSVEHSLLRAFREGARGVSFDISDLITRGSESAVRGSFQKIARATRETDRVLAVRCNERVRIEDQFDLLAHLLGKSHPRLLISYLPRCAEEREKCFEIFQKKFGKSKDTYLDMGSSAGRCLEGSRMLPEWVFERTGNVLKHLRDPWMLKRIIPEVRIPPGKLIVAYAAGHENWVGHSLDEFVERLGEPSRESVLMRMLEISGLRLSFFSSFPDEHEIDATQRVIGSFCGGAFAPSQRAFLGSGFWEYPYPYLLQQTFLAGPQFVKSFSIASSTQPARLFGLHERGDLTVGNYADIIIVNDRLKYTFVNGRVAYDAASENRPPSFHGSVL